MNVVQMLSVKRSKAATTLRNNLGETDMKNIIKHAVKNAVKVVNTTTTKIVEKRRSVVNWYSMNAAVSANMFNNNKALIAATHIGSAVLNHYVNETIAKKCDRNGHKKTAKVFRALNMYSVVASPVFLYATLKAADRNIAAETESEE